MTYSDEELWYKIDGFKYRIFVCCSELKKLSEESLTRQPEEVFDIICKLGEGSYGSVYKVSGVWRDRDTVHGKPRWIYV